jgi:hypothetical protein
MAKHKKKQPAGRAAGTVLDGGSLLILGLGPAASLDDVALAVEALSADRDRFRRERDDARGDLLAILEVAELRGYDFTPFSRAVALDHMRALKAADVRAVAAERQAARAGELLARSGRAETDAVEVAIDRAASGLMAGVLGALEKAGLAPERRARIRASVK